MPNPKGVVTIHVNRDLALMLYGWINAHRPWTDWEPEFLGIWLSLLKHAADDPPDLAKGGGK